MRRNIQWAALALLVTLALLVSGVTYARYREAVSQEMAFTAKTLTENGTFLLTSSTGWKQAENGITLAFTLSFEGTAAKRPAALRLTATEALSPNAQVTLTVGDAVYTATRTTVAQDSVLYTQMGAGYEFYFEDTEGEIRWYPSESQTMYLSVQGTSDAALLRLTVHDNERS